MKRLVSVAAAAGCAAAWSGAIFATDTSGGSVRRLDCAAGSGNCVAAVIADVKGPSRMLAAGGRLLVVETDAGVVTEVDPWCPSSCCDQTAVIDTASRGYPEPLGLAYCGGKLFVSFRNGVLRCSNCTQARVDCTQSCELILGGVAAGAGPSDLSSPYVDCGTHGTVLISDSGNRRIQSISDDCPIPCATTTLRTFNGVSPVASIQLFAHPGWLLSSEMGGARVSALIPNVAPMTYGYGVSYPGGAVQAENSLIVADADGHVVTWPDSCFGNCPGVDVYTLSGSNLSDVAHMDWPTPHEPCFDVCVDDRKIAFRNLWYHVNSQCKCAWMCASYRAYQYEAGSRACGCLEWTSGDPYSQAIPAASLGAGGCVVCPGEPAQPTSGPTAAPTRRPMAQPTATPAVSPTRGPVHVPTAGPRAAAAPSRSPARPTLSPSAAPTAAPAATPAPTAATAAPTARPSAQPSGPPVAAPTAGPKAAPLTVPPSAAPRAPTASPAAESPSPSRPPSRRPTSSPRTPSVAPTRRPSAGPALKPIAADTINPHRDAAATAMTAAAVAAVLAGPAPGMASLSLLSDDLCGSDVPEAGLSIILHPLRFEVAGSQDAGCVVGNTLIVLALSLLHVGTQELLLPALKRRGRDPALFTAMTKQPGCFFIILVTLYQGVTLASARLLVRDGVSRWLRYPVGGVGTALFVVGLPAAMWVLVLQHVRHKMRFIPEQDCSWWKEFLLGSGEWCSLNEHWHYRYGGLVTQYKPPYAVAAVYAQMAETASLSLFAAWPKDRRAHCGAFTLLYVIAICAHGMWCFSKDVYARPRDKVYEVLVTVLTGGAMACRSFAYWAQDDPGEILFEDSAYLLDAAFGTLAVKLILDLGCFAYVVKTGRATDIQRRLEDEMEWAERAETTAGKQNSESLGQSDPNIQDGGGGALKLVSSVTERPHSPLMPHSPARLQAGVTPPVGLLGPLARTPERAGRGREPPSVRSPKVLCARSVTAEGAGFLYTSQRRSQLLSDGDSPARSSTQRRPPSPQTLECPLLPSSVHLTPKTRRWSHFPSQQSDEAPVL
eukprot:TRINITY_DN8659_c3_g1_i1.p1 TRINITY_DN8659_c3_g1~~TRINITY_DN8659_c3_g1_i1.p1  ORF type:complete len:1056 (+),score=284.00 TRINITY_DN8659_c3_g1_i1:73-3240(+)